MVIQVYVLFKFDVQNKDGYYFCGGFKMKIEKAS
jgi:hypothetical protein